MHAVLGSAGPGEDETLAADFHLFSERGRAGNARAARCRAVAESRPQAGLPLVRRGGVPADRLPHRVPHALQSRAPPAGPVGARAGSGRRRRDRGDPARPRGGHRRVRDEPERGEARQGARARRRRCDRAGRPPAGPGRCRARDGRQGDLGSLAQVAAAGRHGRRRRRDDGCRPVGRSRPDVLAPALGRRLLDGDDRRAPPPLRVPRADGHPSARRLRAFPRRRRPARSPDSRRAPSSGRSLSSPSRRLGFIGLGNLGRPLAANLLAAGFPLTVHDRDAEAARQLVADGAAWADSPAEVAAASDTVFTCLPSPRPSRRCSRARTACSTGFAPGGTWIDSSTNDRHELERLAALAAAQGIGLPRGAGHRRRPPRRRRARSPCIVGGDPDGLRRSPAGVRGDRRPGLPRRPARQRLGAQGDHEHARVHPPRRRRRGADAGQARRARPGAGVRGDQGELRQQLRARDREPGDPQRQLRHRLHARSRLQGSRLRPRPRRRARRAARARRRSSSRRSAAPARRTAAPPGRRWS